MSIIIIVIYVDTLELKVLSQELVAVHGSGSKIKSATKKTRKYGGVKLEE